MATQKTVHHECIGKYFIAAILLTGSVRRAEAAVLDGIESMDLDRIALSACATEVPYDIHAVALLPAELHRVLRLAPHLRRYFVLRMLLGIPRERCAALLGVNVAQVDQGTRMAITGLARIAGDRLRDTPLPLSGHFDLLQVGICN